MSDAGNSFAAWGSARGQDERLGASRPALVPAPWLSRVGAVFVLFAFGLHAATYVTNTGMVIRRTSDPAPAISGLIYLVYACILMGRGGAGNGRTIGKQRMQLRVVRNSGEPVDLGTVVLREGVGKYLLPLLYILRPGAVTLGLAALYGLVDYLLPLWERENRALHDLLAHTRVVEAPYHSSLS
jgi:uncharacterized RDD family membrane protein YckC